MNKNLQQAREKLDAKLAPARAWYEQREPREQRILQALALLVAAALVYWLIWQPAWDARDAARAVLAIQADRRRRTVLRWGSALTTAAACFRAVFVLQGGADDALAQRARALAASDESAQLSDILGFADELSVLTPVIDRHSVVDVLINPDL